MRFGTDPIAKRKAKNTKLTPCRGVFRSARNRSQGVPEAEGTRMVEGADAIATDTPDETINGGLSV